MSLSESSSFVFNLKNTLGLLFIGLALFGLYWVAGMFYSLWNAPDSVPFTANPGEGLSAPTKPISI